MGFLGFLGLGFFWGFLGFLGVFKGKIEVNLIGVNLRQFLIGVGVIWVGFL